MVGSEFRPQTADVDVDGARAAEVVVAPDLLQQLLPGEHAAGMLGQELEQLELLECEIESAALELGRVGGVVDDEPARRDDVPVSFVVGRSRDATDGKP